jgi:exodeoxyribonuclease-5
MVANTHFITGTAGTGRATSVKDIVIVTGAAGTGKTHWIINSSKSMIKIGRQVMIVAPTNRAAKVLNKRLEEHELEATTLHKALYLTQKTGEKRTVKKPITDPITGFPKTDKTGQTLFHYEEEDIYEYQFNRYLGDVVLIIDEASMVPSHIWEDIFTYFTGTLVVVGDPNQLMPVDKKDDVVPEYFQFFNKMATMPTVNLGTDKDNKRLSDDTSGIQAAIKHINATANKSGNFPDLQGQAGYFYWDATYGPVMGDLVKQAIFNSDVVICWRVDECKYINQLYRQNKADQQGKAYKEVPVVGDRIIADGHYYIEIAKGYGDKPIRERIITKGDELIVVEIGIIDVANNIMWVKLRDENGFTFENAIALSVAGIFGDRVTPGLQYLRWAYGYAITCHKAQGSGFGTVVVLDSYYMPKDARRWRYTAATRAKENLIVVKSNESFVKKAAK